MSDKVKNFTSQGAKTDPITSEGDLVPTGRKTGETEANVANENKFIALLVLGIGLVFLMAQYVDNIVYGATIIGLFIVILNILARRWRISEGDGLSKWILQRFEKAKD